MKPRSAHPAAERRDRSRLAQLAHTAHLLRGSLVLMRPTRAASPTAAARA